MSITITVPDTSNVSQKELDALIGFFVALGGSVPVETHTAMPKFEVHVSDKAIAPVADAQPPIVDTPLPAPVAFLSAADALQAQVATANGDTIPLVPPPTTDLANVFGGGTAAPSAPVTPSAAPVTTNTVDLDKNGLPWDARIHASTKAINADGTWRNKRGVDAATLTTVEAELRQTMAAPAPASVMTAPAPVATERTFAVAPPSATTAVPVAPAPVAAPIPTAPAPSVAAPTPGAMTFKEFMSFMTPHVANKRILPPQLQAIATELGLPHIGGLQAREDLIPTVIAKVNELLAAAA